MGTRLLAVHGAGQDGGRHAGGLRRGGEGGRRREDRHTLLLLLLPPLLLRPLAGRLKPARRSVRRAAPLRHRAPRGRCGDHRLLVAAGAEGSGCALEGGGERIGERGGRSGATRRLDTPASPRSSWMLARDPNSSDFNPVHPICRAGSDVALNWNCLGESLLLVVVRYYCSGALKRSGKNLSKEIPKDYGRAGNGDRQRFGVQLIRAIKATHQSSRVDGLAGTCSGTRAEGPRLRSLRERRRSHRELAHALVVPRAAEVRLELLARGGSATGAIGLAEPNFVLVLPQESAPCRNRPPRGTPASADRTSLGSARADGSDSKGGLVRVWSGVTEGACRHPSPQQRIRAAPCCELRRMPTSELISAWRAGSAGSAEEWADISLAGRPSRPGGAAEPGQPTSGLISAWRGGRAGRARGWADISLACDAALVAEERLRLRLRLPADLWLLAPELVDADALLRARELRAEVVHVPAPLVVRAEAKVVVGLGLGALPLLVRPCEVAQRSVALLRGALPRRIRGRRPPRRREQGRGAGTCAERREGTCGGQGTLKALADMLRTPRARWATHARGGERKANSPGGLLCACGGSAGAVPIGGCAGTAPQRLIYTI
eukprot:gene215-biopygen6438